MTLTQTDRRQDGDDVVCQFGRKLMSLVMGFLWVDTPNAILIGCDRNNYKNCKKLLGLIPL